MKQADAACGAPFFFAAWNKDVMSGAKATILGPRDDKRYFKDSGMEKTLMT